MNRYSLLAGVAAACLALAGCSSTTSDSASKKTTPPAASDTGAPAAAGSSQPITIKGFAYSGGLSVKAGQTVTVTNNDQAAHTVTDTATKLFDTGNIAGGGATGSFTAPTKPGTYKFGCTYHPNMAGTLTVTG